MTKEELVRRIGSLPDDREICIENDDGEPIVIQTIEDAIGIAVLSGCGMRDYAITGHRYL